MFISANTLLHKLLFLHPEWHMDKSSSFLLTPISGVGMLPPETSARNDGILYVCTESQKSSLPEKACSYSVLVISSSDKTSISHTQGIYTLFAESDISYVLNELIQIYNQFRDWEKNLDIEIIQGNNLQKIIDFSEYMIGYPIMLYDGAMKLLAHTKHLHPASNEDWIFQTTAEKGYLTNRDISIFLEEDVFVNISKEGHLISNDVFQKNLKNIYYAVKTNEQLHAYLTILCMEESEVTYVEELTILLTSKLQYYFQKNIQNIQAKQQQFDYLFTEFTENDSMTKEDQLERLHYMGFSNETKYHLIKVPIPNAHKFPPAHLRMEFSNLLSTAMITLNKESIYIFLPLNHGKTLSTANQQLQHTLVAIEPLLKYYKTICAISQAFEEIIFLRQAYLQCDFTISHAINHHLTGKLFLHYDDCKVDHMLALYQNMLSLEAFIHPQIKLLSTSTSQKANERLEILRCYLECNCRLSKVSQRMNKPRNTLLYHIEQLEYKHKINFDDMNERLQLLLSFKVLDFFKNTLS